MIRGSGVNLRSNPRFSLRGVDARRWGIRLCRVSLHASLLCGGTVLSGSTSVGCGELADDGTRDWGAIGPGDTTSESDTTEGLAPEPSGDTTTSPAPSLEPSAEPIEPNGGATVTVEPLAPSTEPSTSSPPAGT